MMTGYGVDVTESDKQSEKVLTQIRGSAGGNTYEGLPYVGPVYDIRKEDSEELKPELKYEVKARVFKIGVPEHIKEYTEANQAIVEGRAVLSFEERKFDKGSGEWSVFMMWTEMHYEPPRAVIEAMEKEKNSK